MPKEQKNRHSGSLVLPALIGGVAGALVGLLVSPKSGEVFRRDIKTKAVSLVNQAEETAYQQAEAIKQKSVDLMEKSQQVVVDIKNLINDLKDKKSWYIDLDNSSSAPDETEVQLTPIDKDNIITLP